MAKESSLTFTILETTWFDWVPQLEKRCFCIEVSRTRTTWWGKITIEKWFITKPQGGIQYFDLWQGADNYVKYLEREPKFTLQNTKPKS